MGQRFNEDDVDPDVQKHWAVRPDAIADMLDLEEIGSSDYNTVKAIQQGKVDTYAGFSWFWSNRLPADAAGDTCWRTIAFTQGACILAYIGDLTSEFSKRADLRNETQLYSRMDLGAVRMEGVQVHECLLLKS